MSSGKNSGILRICRSSRLLTIGFYLLFLFVSYDGNRDWDENTYLARTAYLNVWDLDSWLMQSGRAAWEYDWYRAKISHLLLLDFFFALFGIGKSGLFCVSLMFALMMVAVGFWWERIIRSITENDKYAKLSAILTLSTPVALYLSYKALTETTAIFFVVLSLYLFVSSWTAKNGWKFGLMACSAISLLGGVTSRMEVITLFYAFGIGMLLYNPRQYRNIIKKFVIFSIFFAIAGVLFFAITGINPYTAADNQQLSGCVRDYPYNVMNSLLAVGVLWPLIILGILNFKRPILRLGASIYILPTVALLIVLLTVAMRHQYMGILGAGLIAALGLERIKKLRLLGESCACSVVTVMAILAVNLFLMRTLGEVGLVGRELDSVLNIAKDVDSTIYLTDGPTNTFSYLRVAYPELCCFPTSKGVVSDPQAVENIDELRNASQGKEISYIFAYNKQRSWLEKIVDRIKGRSPAEIRRGEMCWLASDPGIELSPVVSKGRYTIYHVNIIGE
ncbi:MAG TPA: glycosyltransferase family 39 protein [bacterium]|nr:glycosyltransferase family 39 protein [bacterium]